MTWCAKPSPVAGETPSASPESQAPRITGRRSSRGAVADTHPSALSRADMVRVATQPLPHSRYAPREWRGSALRETAIGRQALGYSSVSSSIEASLASRSRLTLTRFRSQSAAASLKHAEIVQRGVSIGKIPSVAVDRTARMCKTIPASGQRDRWATPLRGTCHV